MDDLKELEFIIGSVKQQVLTDVFTIIGQTNRLNDNGTHQYACELIAKKINKELLGKNYTISYREKKDDTLS